MMEPQALLAASSSAFDEHGVPHLTVANSRPSPPLRQAPTPSTGEPYDRNQSGAFPANISDSTTAAITSSLYLTSIYGSRTRLQVSRRGASPGRSKKRNERETWQLTPTRG